jgi:hypothetical protein
MDNGQMGRHKSSSASSKKTNTTPVKTRKEVMDKILSIEEEMARQKERIDNATNSIVRFRFKNTYDRLMKSHDKAMAEYDKLPQEPRSQRVPPPPTMVEKEVKPHLGLDREDIAPASAKRLVRRNRPSTVETQSKEPLAKRIMEALGDTRTMAQASKDAKVTKDMEMEREMNVAGRKKGGMAKKKKAPVKKAYGGMVKKKHGGSANKVNMKAGFTRRGCSKG